MSDLIQKSELIEEVQKYFVNNSIHKNDLAEVIAKLPTVEAKPVVHGEWVDTKGVIYPQSRCSICGEWIPCSERLPEDETLMYWTTHEDGSLVLHGYKKSNGFIYNWEVNDLEKRKRQGQVIAWIPIFEPAPYNAYMRKKGQ